MKTRYLPISILYLAILFMFTSCLNTTGDSAAQEAFSKTAATSVQNTESGLKGTEQAVPVYDSNKPEPKTFKFISKLPDTIKEGILIKKYSPAYTSFRIRTSKDITIITDPYEMDEDIEADIVTESHQHLDHCDVSRIKGSYKLFTDPGEYNVKGINIAGIAGHHNVGDMAGTNNIFVFDIDGIRIAEFASQGQEPDEEMYKKISSADVLILQLFDGNGKLTLEECRKITTRLKSKIIIPAHGDDNLKESFAALVGGDVYIADSNEAYVSKSVIQKITRPRVLILDNWENRTGYNPYTYDGEAYD
ncbi:MAG: MBL fold metallo-hydrolase [Clostridia bacterium]|nr:MBL fold metallo-hydrolase [Clostridia bacterium]